MESQIILPRSRFCEKIIKVSLQAVLGMDILSQAKSGMGKTAVFVLATLQQIEPVDGQVIPFFSQQNRISKAL